MLVKTRYFGEKDLMEEKVYPLAVETMGQERWDALQGYLEN